MDTRSLAISFFAAFLILSILLRGQYGRIALASIILTALSHLSEFGFLGFAIGSIATIAFVAKAIRLSIPGAFLFTLVYGLLSFIASLYTETYF